MTLFQREISRLSRTLRHVCYYVGEQLESVSPSAAVFLTFVAYLGVLYHLYGHNPKFPW